MTGEGSFTTTPARDLAAGFVLAGETGRGQLRFFAERDERSRSSSLRELPVQVFVAEAEAEVPSLGNVLGRGHRSCVVGFSDTFAVKFQPWDSRVVEELEAAEVLRGTGSIVPIDTVLVTMPGESSLTAVHSMPRVGKNFDVIVRERGGPLEWGAALGVLRDVLLALDRAHAAGILHADVHAGNICMRGSRAVLIDWGSARRLDGPRGVYRGPTRGGRWTCMAPEQFSVGGDDVTLDPSSDVFAAVKTFLFLATGSDRTPLEACRSRASPALMTALRHALDPDRRRRAEIAAGTLA